MQKTRRQFIRASLVAGAGLACTPIVGSATKRNGPATRVLNLNRGWRFGEKLSDASLQPAFDDQAFPDVDLPHCVCRLSWQKWETGSWATVWVYRHGFSLPDEFRSARIFLHFEGVMTGATPIVNGHALPEHLGGYLPFDREITTLVKPTDNLIAVAVDARWLNVPPDGSPKGPISVDYLEPGGIWGGVALRAVPQVFIADVFAKPVQVLNADRRVEVDCCLDAALVPPGPIRLAAELKEGDRIVQSVSRNVVIEKTGATHVPLTLAGLHNVALWDLETPKLYDIVVTAYEGDKPIHDYRARIGFREARFELDGFFLNGRRVQLFGLNRHELYPYVGRAMPRRVLRRDAEILRRDFNCNMVRCSHYPQSEAFLDACDELGLLVWEEIPGWQYIGDSAWQELAVRDTADMVRRDRNHPSIIIWGVRVNESPNNPALYSRTKQVAKALDDSRPTSGSMVYHSKKDWLQDVFAFDDYHAAPDGGVGLVEPLPGSPFLFAEVVGQFDYGTGRGFSRRYRRAGDLWLQTQQAILHAQAHSKAGADKRYCGAIAWCAFDYASLFSAQDHVKAPGVADVFRIPKLGASFYLSQVDPRVRPVIEPNFYWDFGPQSPSGPGDRAAIFSNCDRLVLTVAGKRHAVLHPDRAGFPNIEYPPFFANLSIDAAARPELRIDGYVGDQLALSRSFSADTSQDQLSLRADDAELLADGSDATRLAFCITDRYGALRPFARGKVSLDIEGPGVIVGDNPFDLADAGGVGAVWIRTLPDAAGVIRVSANHPSFGTKSATISVKPSS